MLVVQQQTRRSADQKPGKTRIEDVRRRDLVDAAYAVFLEHGLRGMTMARIGQRAGMSHGIVNYYFKNKDILLNTVIRHANALMVRDTARRLREAKTPRERISAILATNFAPEFYTPDIAKAWVSYYSAITEHADFERVQKAVDRRLQSNLRHAIRPIMPEDAVDDLVRAISAMIDGYWLRRSRSTITGESAGAIATIESFVDRQIAGAQVRQAASGGFIS